MRTITQAVLILIATSSCNNDESARLIRFEEKNPVVSLDRSDGARLVGFFPVRFEVIQDYGVTMLTGAGVEGGADTLWLQLQLTERDLVQGKASGRIGLRADMPGAAFVSGIVGGNHLKATRGTIEISIEHGIVRGRIDVVPKELSAELSGKLTIQCAFPVPDREGLSVPDPELESSSCQKYKHLMQ